MPNLAFPNDATPIGSIAYYAIRFSSPDKQDALAARYNWLNEIDRIVTTIKDPGVARLKLDWWKKEWAQALNGKATHPISLACNNALSDNALSIIENIVISSEKAILGFSQLNDRDWLAEIKQRAHLKFSFLTGKPLIKESSNAALRSELYTLLFSLPQQLSIGRQPLPQAHLEDAQKALTSVEHFNVLLNAPIWQALTKQPKNQHDEKLIDRFLLQQEADLKRLRKVGFTADRYVAFPIVRLIRAWQARDV